jgi:pimeloyl-ACP methyl ester carboxylesterase
MSAPAAAGPPPTALPPGAAAEDVSFENPGGERLAGVLVAPPGATRAAVLAHGYLGNMSMCRFPLLAAALAERGLAVLRFDHPCAFRSRSQRAGDFKMGNHAAECADIAAAAAFLRARGLEPAVLVGHSKGGINALRYAATAAGAAAFPRVVWLAGRYRCRDGVLARFGANVLDRFECEGAIERTESPALDSLKWTMTREDVMERVEADTAGWAAAVRANDAVEFFCVHGTADATIPAAESEECAAAAGAALALVPGGDHNFTAPAAAREMVARVVEWAAR